SWQLAVNNILLNLTKQDIPLS
ncbi:hypothetical protein EHRUM3_11240, partial [Ehrlichia ruminantium]